MLLSLRIKNYAIIKQTEINFTDGLNIITGETGAGKSILVGALGLILGNRADTKALLQGQDKCVVEGVFNLKDYPIIQFFTDNELDFDEQAILRREITSSGKSRAFINDTPVSLQLLKSLGQQLVDIVSQHQTLELNEEAFQLELIDAISDNGELLKNYRNIFGKWVQTKKHLTVLQEKENQAKKDEDYIKFILKEFEDAALKPGEQEMLESLQQQLNNAGVIQQACSNAAAMIDGSENAITDIIRTLKSTLATPARFYPKLTDLIKRIESSLIELNDVASELSAVADMVQHNPLELSKTEERLQQIYHLQKKHKVDSIDELLQIEYKYATDLTALGSLEKEIESATKALELFEKELSEQAALLHQQRVKAAQKMMENIQQLLNIVALPNAQFAIELLKNNEYNYNGITAVKFLFSANKGFSMLPVNKAASGGELSRLMLCVKSMISDKVKLPTVIFDEIDTGISGQVSEMVGRAMKKLSRHCQIIAITHQAPIAAQAEHHYRVEKVEEADRTLTHIVKLTHEDRVREIAVLMSGSTLSEAALESARQLMDNGK